MSTLFRVNGFIKLKKEEGIIDRALETLTSFVNAFEPSEPTVVLKNGWFDSQSFFVASSPEEEHNYRKQRVVTEVMEILAPMFTEDTLQAVADLLRKDPL